MCVYNGYVCVLHWLCDWPMSKLGHGQSAWPWWPNDAADPDDDNRYCGLQCVWYVSQYVCLMRIVCSVSSSLPAETINRHFPLRPWFHFCVCVFFSFGSESASFSFHISTEIYLIMGIISVLTILFESKYSTICPTNVKEMVQINTVKCNLHTTISRCSPSITNPCIERSNLWC